MVALKTALDNGMPTTLADAVLSQLSAGKVDSATARAVQDFMPAGQQLPAAVVDTPSSGATGAVLGSIAVVLAVGAALVVYQQRSRAAAQSNADVRPYSASDKPVVAYSAHGYAAHQQVRAGY